MKKYYQIILSIILLVLAIWIMFTITIDTLLIILIFLNIIIYLGKSVFLRISNEVFKRKTIRYVISLTVNIIWLVFLFQFLFYIETLFTGSSAFSIAIISFLIVAISFTLKDRINNITSGVMILTTEGFEVGDLIETNGVKGVVTELTLNYTKIRDFQGIITYLPNDNVFNAPVKKYTFKKQEMISSDSNGSAKSEANILKKYVKRFNELIIKNEKIARFVQVVELLPSVDMEKFASIFSEISDKYEPILGIKPFYYANTSVVDRLSITIQLLSNKPKLLILFVHRFLKDLLYKLYPEEIYYNWEEGIEKGLISNQNEGGVS